MLLMGKATISTGPFSVAIYVCLPEVNGIFVGLIYLQLGL